MKTIEPDINELKELQTSLLELWDIETNKEIKKQLFKKIEALTVQIKRNISKKSNEVYNETLNTKNYL